MSLCNTPELPLGTGRRGTTPGDEEKALPVAMDTEQALSSSINRSSGLKPLYEEKTRQTVTVGERPDEVGGKCRPDGLRLGKGLPAMGKCKRGPTIDLNVGQAPTVTSVAAARGVAGHAMSYHGRTDRAASIARIITRLEQRVRGLGGHLEETRAQDQTGEERARAPGCTGSPTGEEAPIGSTEKAPSRPTRGTASLGLSSALRMIKPFDGTKHMNLDRFIRSCEGVWGMVIPEQRYTLLTCIVSRKLEDQATQELRRTAIYTLQDLRVDLEAYYGKQGVLALLQRQLCELRQGARESVSTYAARTRTLTSRVINELCKGTSAPRARHIAEATQKGVQVYFENGLRTEVRKIVRSRGCQSLDESVTGALEAERTGNLNTPQVSSGVFNPQDKPEPPTETMETPPVADTVGAFRGEKFVTDAPTREARICVLTTESVEGRSNLGTPLYVAEEALRSGVTTGCVPQPPAPFSWSEDVEAFHSRQPKISVPTVEERLTHIEQMLGSLLCDWMLRHKPESREASKKVGKPAEKNLERTAKKNPERATTEKTTRKCYLCQDIGHIVRDCPLRVTLSKKVTALGKEINKTCNHCKRPGHLWKECRFRLRHSDGL